MPELAIRTAYMSSISLSPDQFAMTVKQAVEAVKRKAEQEGRTVKFKGLEGGTCPCDPDVSKDPKEPHQELMLVFEDA